MTPRRRRRRALERLGTVRPDALGLPARRANELALAIAWRSVAGEALARRATALRMRRGVLEIARPESPWRETLIELLPRLASQLASHYPELGVKRFRFVDVETGGCARVVESAGAAPGPSAWPPVANDPASRPAEGTASREERLRALGRLYLDRRRSD